MLKAFHITSAANLPSIMAKGLQPSTPKDFGKDGDIEGVYLFTSEDEAINALYNWLGERIDETEWQTGIPYNEVLLTVNLDGLQVFQAVDWEIICLEPIESDRILSIKYDI